MLRTPPHPAEQADRTKRLLARIRVALVAMHTVGLTSQRCWPRPGQSTGPAPREATP
jgi:hypothetical protein